MNPVNSKSKPSDFWNEALAALLLAALGFAWILSLLRLGPDTLAWMTLRMSGIAAYVGLALSVLLGVLLSSGYAPAWLVRASQYGWHGILAGFSLLASGLHGAFLLVDHLYPQSLLQILLPGAASVKPLAVGLGTLALYGLLVTYLSFAWRSKLPQKLWRRLHLLSYPAFLLATLHGSWAGSDPLQPLYLTALATTTLAALARFARR